MKTRMEPLVAVDKPGHFVVDVADKGPHHFRLPALSQTQRIADYWNARPVSDDAHILEQAGITIGLAWRHESLEIEAVYPDDNPTDAALTTYSIAVQRELEEAGYTMADVIGMCFAIARKVNARVAESAEAKKLADFTSAAAPAAATPTT
jgi:hypothetical protein